MTKKFHRKRFPVTFTFKPANKHVNFPHVILNNSDGFTQCACIWKGNHMDIGWGPLMYLLLQKKPLALRIQNDHATQIICASQKRICRLQQKNQGAHIGFTLGFKNDFSSLSPMHLLYCYLSELIYQNLFLKVVNNSLLNFLVKLQLISC